MVMRAKRDTAAAAMSHYEHLAEATDVPSGDKTPIYYPFNCLTG
jgi:hypothetical protein